MEPSDASAAQVAGYSELMSASQPLVADAILDAVDLSRHRCLLDFGGGEGRFLIVVATRAPRLQPRLFDPPLRRWRRDAWPLPVCRSAPVLSPAAFSSTRCPKAPTS